MAYTALLKCASPSNVYKDINKDGKGLKEMAVAFLHNTCEELRFDKNKSGEEESGARQFSGKSNNKKIPYNMEKDIDRLCMENSLKHFLDSGTSQDAFNVYFCYIDMFLGSYGECRHIIEMLSEFESNGSSLLMKHRDHYSHSVYVFALGLAIYESNKEYKRVYREYYQCNSELEAAHHFLKYWGLSSLFHDIGYPFELPFEEVWGYFESDRDYVDDRDKKKNRIQRYNRPYMTYQNVEKCIGLNEKQSKELLNLYELDKDIHFFSTTNDLFAYDLENKLGKEYRFTKDSMSQILGSKPTRPDLFGNYMDHAYWSATMLFRELYETLGVWGTDNEKGMNRVHIDALTAILLHNSLYKFSIAFVKSDINKTFRMTYHPLAYMLMLCDELQCWDRTSYGRNSRTQFHPMDCRFEFGDASIKATYIFDEAGKDKIEKFEKGEIKKLKSYSDMVGKNDFLSDIRDIVETEGTSGIRLEVGVETEARDFSKKHTYLSESNFIHLYDFASVLNARYNFLFMKKEELPDGIQSYADIMNLSGEEKRAELVKFVEYITSDAGREQAYQWFKELSLEYKLSNVNQAKGFAKGLDMIGAFYTDRPVDFDFYDMTVEDAMRFGPAEHYRWLKEHEEMGWVYGDEKEYGEAGYKAERERKRIHKDMVPDSILAGKNEIDEASAKSNYDRLGGEEQNKDTAPMELMMYLLPAFEGVRFYKYR